MTDTAPRCPNCVASTGLHLALVLYDNILHCTLCAFTQPLPPSGRIVVASAVVYEQQATLRVVQEEVHAASE